MRKTGQYFEKLGTKAKIIIKENKRQIKEYQDRITFLFDHKLDPAQIHRSDLNRKIRELRIENNSIRKGLKVIPDVDLAADELMK